MALAVMVIGTALAVPKPEAVRGLRLRFAEPVPVLARL
jgi:hypothetical protein